MLSGAIQDITESTGHTKTTEMTFAKGNFLDWLRLQGIEIDHVE